MLAINPAQKTFAALKKAGLTLVTAESLTGGMIGEKLTAIPGSSDVYWGGIVSYSVDAKQKMLSVPLETIVKYGVVSRETALAMASGALGASGADVSVAVTGVAGPGGGSDSVPVGTVWIAVACREGLKGSGTPDDGGTARNEMRDCARRIAVRGTRARVRSETVRAALRLVLYCLDRK